MKFKRPLATAILSLLICMSVVAQNTVFQARVIQVVDGTTVVVETQLNSQFHVRCSGAVAPREQESFGTESKQRLSAVLLGETVTIESSRRDENDHLLGSIRLHNRNVCLDQVRSGLASLDTETANNLSSSDRSSYAQAESIARNNAIGLWATNTGTSQSYTKESDRVTTTPADLRDYFRKDATSVSLQKHTASDSVGDDTGSTYTRRSWLRRNWWIFPTVGALIGGGYLLYRYNNGTGGGDGAGIPCRDGTVSHAQNRQGACSHHGGILR